MWIKNFAIGLENEVSGNASGANTFIFMTWLPSRLSFKKKQELQTANVNRTTHLFSWPGCQASSQTPSLLPRYYKVDLRTITLGVPPQEVWKRKKQVGHRTKTGFFLIPSWYQTTPGANERLSHCVCRRSRVLQVKKTRSDKYYTVPIFHTTVISLRKSSLHHQMPNPQKFSFFTRTNKLILMAGCAMQPWAKPL